MVSGVDNSFLERWMSVDLFCLQWLMASVLVAHMCETGVKLPTEGSGIVLFFLLLAGWTRTFFVLSDELPQCSWLAFVQSDSLFPFHCKIWFVRLRGLNCLLGAAESDLWILRGVYSRVMYRDLKRTCFDFIWLFICYREDSSFCIFTSGKFCRLTVALLC